MNDSDTFLSTRHTFSDINGIKLGSVKRHGARSLWKAHYDIYDGMDHIMTIREANPFTKLADAIIDQLKEQEVIL